AAYILCTAVERFGSARALMIDGATRNREHCGRRQRGKKWREQKHRALAEHPAHAACDQRYRHVAAMSESRVSSDAARKLLTLENPERQRCHRRPEDVAGDRHQAVRD